MSGWRIGVGWCMIRMTRSDSLWQMCLGSGIISNYSGSGRGHWLHHRDDDCLYLLWHCDSLTAWVFQDQVTHVTNEPRGGLHTRQYFQDSPGPLGAEILEACSHNSFLRPHLSLVSQSTMLPSVTSLSIMTTLVFMTRVYITFGATLPYSLILPKETKCKEYRKSIAPSIAQNTNGEFKLNLNFSVLPVMYQYADLI